ncbi:MAG: type II toxin-antitoxin system HicA family toxin [Candidatus Aenigmarchaeota archaeon]|nr:type II toxin-antitoxin system HicA family toxin [Candidatus Aenigmarchaeota archaeon]
MVKMPLITAKELIKILNRLGFEFKRQHGSHQFFEHIDGRTTVVPVHPGEKLDRGLLNKIVKQDLNMNRDEFLDFLGKKK